MLKKKKKGLFSPKTYNWIDIASIKFAVFAFTLFLVSYIPKIADINLRWFWFVIFTLAIIRPAAKFWKD